MSRPSIADVMLRVALALSTRSTCHKLAVGAVLTDERDRICGTGYNGVPHGMAHCTDAPCAGACAPRGSDLCEAVHAEQNALLTCPDPFKVKTAYVTHAPCMRCTKMLLNTSCRRIVFLHAGHEPAAQDLWLRAGGEWVPHSWRNDGTETTRLLDC